MAELNKERHVVNVGPGGMITDADKAIGFDGSDYYSAVNLVTDHSLTKKENISSFLNIYTGTSTGSSYLVAAIEDKKNNKVVFLLYNSTLNHKMILYDPTFSSYEELISGSVLEILNKANGVIINGQYCIWADGKYSNDDISGNPVRCVDLVRISRSGKALEYILGISPNAFYAGNAFTVQVKDLNNNVIVSSTTFYTSSGGAFSTELANMVSAYNAGSYQSEMINVGDHVIVKALFSNRKITITDTGGYTLLWGTNHYPDLSNSTWDKKCLNLYVPNPPGIIKPEYQNTSSINSNAFDSKEYKFMYRYIYYDGRKSKWSMESYIPTNYTRASTTSETKNDISYNTIKLYFANDALIKSDFWRYFIKAVEIAYKIGGSEIYKRHSIVPIYKIYHKYTSTDYAEYTIYDDGVGTAIESDDSGPSESQVLGLYSNIPIYCAAVEAVSDTDGRSVLLLGGNKYTYEFPSDLTYTHTKSSILASSPPTTPTPQKRTSAVLKGGGSYSIGVSFEDWEGRCTPVKKLLDIDVPFTYPGASEAHYIQLGGTPPDWCWRYKLYISQNKRQWRYYQLPCIDVNYWRVDNGNYISTTYAAGDADYVGFVFDAEDEGDQNVIFKNSNRFFIPENGDKIVIYDGTTNYIYDIVGYNLTWPTGSSSINYRTIFVRFESSQPNFYSKLPFIVEVYRPNRGSSEIYNEVPIVFEIQNPGTPTRAYPTVSTLEYPTDTFVVKTKPYKYLGVTYYYDIEIPTMQINAPYTFNHFGRPNAEDDDYGVREEYNEIRASGIYLPNSSVNDINNFRSADVIGTEYFLGGITRLVYVNTLVLAVMQRGSRSIYVNKNMLFSSSGEGIISFFDRKMSLGPSFFEYGSDQPQSVVLGDSNYVYGVDVQKAAVWRFSVGGGIDVINNGNTNLIKSLCDQFSIRDEVVGGYDGFYSIYFVTFKHRDTTLGFNERTNKWDGYFSFLPDLYGRLADNIVSGYGNKIYKHRDSSVTTYNNFYGTDYYSFITIVVNPKPYLSKIFWSIVVYASKVMGYSLNTDLGYTSRIMPDKFRKYDNKQMCEIPRDANDPMFDSYSILERYARALLQGRHMKGEWLTIEFRLEEMSNYLYFRSLITDYSVIHNK